MKAAAAACGAALMLTACGGAVSPVRPSGLELAPATTLLLEAEAGGGDGVLRFRSNASGGRTVHLAPGERRVWNVPVAAAAQSYTIAVTYSNAHWGDREVVTLLVNGTATTTFEVGETGVDDDGGWNAFVTDPAGNATLGPATHTIAIVSNGGDGCVEIDRIVLVPAGAP
jgi:hypothetical protein